MGEYVFIASAVLSIANGFVLLCVNPRRTINQVFFATSIWIGIWSLCLALAISEGAKQPGGDWSRLLLILRLYSTMGVFVGWLCALAKAALIHEGDSAASLFKRTAGWFALSVAVTLAGFSEYNIPNTSTHTNIHRGPAYPIIMAVTLASCGWFIIDALRASRQLAGARRLEMKYLVGTMLAACTLTICSSLAGLYFDAAWVRRMGPIWFSAGHAVSIWAICYHRIFDAKQVVYSLIQRGVLLVGTAAIGCLIYWSLKSTLPEGWLIAVVAAGATGLAMSLDGPMRRLLKLNHSQTLIAPRLALITQARGEPDEEKLMGHFQEVLRFEFGAVFVALFPKRKNVFKGLGLELKQEWEGLKLITKNSWITPESIQRSRVSPGSAECATLLSEHRIGALLSVPRGSKEPSMLVAVGLKESLRPYTHTDIQKLLELSELVDNILTHARVAAHAAQIEKLETAAMISRGLAHDLNNLVTPVSTFLYHIEPNLTHESDETEVLGHARSSISAIQDYVRESLLFARRMVPQNQDFATSTLMQRVAEVGRIRARDSQVTVALQVESNVIMRGDYALLQRLFQNLVNNSVDAVEPVTGKVWLHCGQLPDGRLQFQVSDNGSGIAPEIAGKVFEPYFTTKDTGRARRGLGLGLAIVQKIVELHGGQIQITPNVPHGTKFTVILPATQPAGVASAEADEPQQADTAQPAPELPPTSQAAPA